MVALVEQNIASKKRKMHKSNERFLIPPGRKCVVPIKPPFESPNIIPKPKIQYTKREIPMSVRFFIATFMLFGTIVLNYLLKLLTKSKGGFIL